MSSTSRDEFLSASSQLPYHTVKVARAAMEARLQQYQRDTGSANLPRLPAHQTSETLRSMFDIIPAKGKMNLAHDIVQCEGNEAIQALVDSIVTGLLFPMRSQGGRTPFIVDSPRPENDVSIENLASLDLEQATRSAQRKLKADCLRRDGNKCIISGAWDSSALTQPKAAHIFPFSIGSFNPQDTQERDAMNQIWTNIYRYFPAVPSVLRPSDVNQVDNAMTLVSCLREEYGSFRLILEKTRTLHRYQIVTFNDFLEIPARSLLPSNGFVTFTSHDDRYDLPNPTLLSVHAAIGRILHLTGAAEKLDRIQRHMDESSHGLAPDGSTHISQLLAVSSLSLLPHNPLPTLPETTGKQPRLPVRSPPAPAGENVPPY